MTSYDYDLFTIGGGSGGVRASRVAAGFGARVATAEERYLGGTCVNVGCIPKKLYSYAAHYREEFHHAAGFGWSVGATSFDMASLVQAKDREISRLNGIYRNLLERSGVTVLDGHARLVDAHTVEINGAHVTARYILIATGAWPVKPHLPGTELAITSNEAFALATLPKRMIIVGGGYIAVEFASIFNGMGAQTTLIYRAAEILKGFDRELVAVLCEEMQKKGVDIRLHTNIAAIADGGGSLRATLMDDEHLEADCIMYATGRAPNTTGLGLDSLGVSVNAKGAIIVDEHMRTSVPSIFAIGDVTDRVNLTPVATAEGMALADTLFNARPTVLSYENIPTAIFANPNAAAVGLTEEQARARYSAVDIYAAKFRALKHTLSGSDEQTFLKLVVERASNRVVGAHMVGPDAGEVVQGLAIAIKAGATKAHFDSTIGIHPTVAEEFVTMREPRKDAAPA